MSNVMQSASSGWRRSSGSASSFDFASANSRSASGRSPFWMPRGADPDREPGVRLRAPSSGTAEQRRAHAVGVHRRRRGAKPLSSARPRAPSHVPRAHGQTPSAARRATSASGRSACAVWPARPGAPGRPRPGGSHAGARGSGRRLRAPRSSRRGSSPTRAPRGSGLPLDGPRVAAPGRRSTTPRCRCVAGTHGGGPSDARGSPAGDSPRRPARRRRSAR